MTAHFIRHGLPPKNNYYESPFVPFVPFVVAFIPLMTLGLDFNHHAFFSPVI